MFVILNSDLCAVDGSKTQQLSINYKKFCHSDDEQSKEEESQAFLL